MTPTHTHEHSHTYCKSFNSFHKIGWSLEHYKLILIPFHMRTLKKGLKTGRRFSLIQCQSKTTASKASVTYRILEKLNLKTQVFQGETQHGIWFKKCLNCLWVVNQVFTSSQTTRDKSNTFFFLTIHQEYCQGTQVWEDEERSIYLDEKEKNLLIFYYLEQESLHFMI